MGAPPVRWGGCGQALVSCLSRDTTRTGKNHLAKTKPTSAQRGLRAAGLSPTIGGEGGECHPGDDITAQQTLLCAGAL